MASSSSSECSLCEAEAVELLIDFGSHPIAHRFLLERTDPEYVHPVRLGQCRSCGLAQLIDPIAPEVLYENYRFLTSTKPNPHVGELLSLLDGVDRHALAVEIGCNDGAFLRELRTRGFEKLRGIEPAADAVAAARGYGLEVIHGFFGPELAERLHDRFDLIICRQVIEHVRDLTGFARGLRAIACPGATVLVEVPNFDFSLAAPDYSAIWEEHVNHFTRETLVSFLAAAGVEPLETKTANFSGEALIVLGRFRGGSSTSVRDAQGSREEALAFRNRWPSFQDELRDYLKSHRDAGKKVAAYGAGCRTSCILNFAGLGPLLDFVVDDDPDKQGRFMAGSRLPVVPSSALADPRVGLCLLGVNAENEEKVIGKHRAFLDRGGEFASLHPPSPRLPAFWHPLRASPCA